MRKLLFVVVSLVLFLAFSAEPARLKVEAAPAGAATGQTVTSQVCLSSGLVQITFRWNPSGLGSQWVDVSASPGFNGFANFGPLSPYANTLQWNGLQPNTVYYSRVSTWVGFWLTSDPIAFVTPSCPGAFTPPTGPVSTVLGPTSALFQWNRGTGNQYFCVDTAFSLSDLTTLTGSWHNWGCGTTSTALQANTLACGRLHYWRVYAWGLAGSGYSQYATFQTSGCAFSPPTNPRNFNIGPNSAGFAWDRGTNNYFYCVDIARTQGDLTHLSGTWMNFACGTTGTQASLNGLSCDTTYYWRVWVAGPGTSGYSPIDSLHTSECPYTPPKNLNSSISASGVAGTQTVTFSWVEPTPTTYSCVDYAESQSDLTDHGPTWHNACTTSTSISLVLSCNETYYWRVFAYWNTQNAAYSYIKVFTIDAC